MAKQKSVYLCDDCGYESANWYGKCPGCGAWNTMRELRLSPAKPAAGSAKSAASSATAAPEAVTVDRIERGDEVRQSSGIRELDRVLGGGVVRDMMAGMTPYIFVKHIYACASVAGAALCVALWPYLGQTVSMLCGMAVTVALRVLSAHFRWNLPRAAGVGA